MPSRSVTAVAVAAVLVLGLIASPPARDWLASRGDVPFRPVPAPPRPARDGAGKYDDSGIEVHLAVPERASKNAVIEFTVRLTNTRRTPFELDPCPAYMTNVGESAMVTLREYLLNCAEAPAEIPARGSVDFSMDLPLPDASGPMTVTWRLGQVLSRRHPAATAEIEVSA